jgi:hypothetical protein
VVEKEQYCIAMQDGMAPKFFQAGKHDLDHVDWRLQRISNVTVILNSA